MVDNYLLNNNFYSIQRVEEILPGTQFSCIVNFNPDHTIFKSHFPGFPVTPGMCICQVALELIQIYTSERLSLKLGKNIKFLEIINPGSSGSVTFEFQNTKVDKEIASQIVVRNDEKVFSKLSLIFSSLDN